LWGIFLIGIPGHILTSLFTSAVITVIIGQTEEIMEDPATKKLLSGPELAVKDIGEGG